MYKVLAQGGNCYYKQTQLHNERMRTSQGGVMIDRATHRYMCNTRKLTENYDRWLDSYPDDEPEDDEIAETNTENDE